MIKTTSSNAPAAPGVLSDSDFDKDARQQLPTVSQVLNSAAATTISRTTDRKHEEVKRAKNAGVPGKKHEEERIYREYRRLMDALVEELDRAPDYLDANEKLTDEGSAVTAEVDELFRRLSECPWGQGESLKLAVTVLQIPSRNARWTRTHVAFLQEAARLLRVQYLIDASTVSMCKDCLKDHGLDIFRGSVKEPDVVRRYKIIETDQNEQ